MSRRVVVTGLGAVTPLGHTVADTWDGFVNGRNGVGPVTLFDAADLDVRYAAEVKGGRPGIAPEKLLRAMLLQVLYSVRSERQLMEQVHYNLLFRWFIGLSMDDAVWVPTVFTKNRERLIEHDAVR